MIIDFSELTYFEKVASIIVLSTRIIDTILAIQQKITESNKDLIMISCDYGMQQMKLQGISDSSNVNEDIIEEIIKFFYENKKKWNIIRESKLRVLIKDFLINNEYSKKRN